MVISNQVAILKKITLLHLSGGVQFQNSPICGCYMRLNVLQPSQYILAIY